MKAILVTVLMLVTLGFVKAQKVFSVDYANQADVKVFIVGYENQADLCVYKVEYSNQSGDNDGKWFFTDYENQADKNIYFVDYENQADLNIFFVEYENQAGWKSNKKKDLMYWVPIWIDRYTAPNFATHARVIVPPVPIYVEPLIPQQQTSINFPWLLSVHSSCILLFDQSLGPPDTCS